MPLAELPMQVSSASLQSFSIQFRRHVMSAPFAVMFGLLGIVIGVTLGIVGAILRFTFLKPLGNPLTEHAHRLSYRSGEMIGKGLVDAGRFLVGRRR